MGGKAMRALGLMSGTSMDGIDVALIETDGENSVKRGPSMTFPYTAETRARIVAGVAQARTIEDRVERPGSLSALETEITELHAAAVNAFRRKQASAVPTSTSSVSTATRFCTGRPPRAWKPSRTAFPSRSPRRG